MSSVDVDPSKSTVFSGKVTFFDGGRIIAIGGKFIVVVVVVVVVVVIGGWTTNTAVVSSERPFSSVTVNLIV